MIKKKYTHRPRVLILVVLILGLTGLVGRNKQGISISTVNGSCSSIGNPAYTYCTDIMGYDYKVSTGEDGGQEGYCIMPDDLACPQWDFYAGKCGQNHSFCVKEGFQVETRNDGQDPYNREYLVCTDPEGIEIGNIWSISGYEFESTIQNHDTNSLIRSTLASSDSIINDRDIPSNFTWRDYGGFDWMTSVKNQMSCGSCWAFAAVGLAEAQHNIIPSNPDIDLNFSEQYLVSSCFSYGDCAGGIEPYALEYIRDSGIPDEACYPYTAQNSSCSNRCADYGSRLEYVPNAYWTQYFYPFFYYSEQDIKTIISSYGPVTIAIGISAQQAGSYWDGDILRCTNDIPSGGSDYIDHAVIAVGYNDSGGYWIVKNSWGSSWNGDGYFKLGYNECNVAHSRISWVESGLPGLNQAPVADAGPDQEVLPNTLVTLDGTSSYDPDGNTPITFLWEQVSGTSVSLSSNIVSNPTFTAPVTPEILTFKLIVTDSNGTESDPDFVSIVVGELLIDEIFLPLIIGDS